MKFIILMLFSLSAVAGEVNISRIAMNTVVILDWAQTRYIADSEAYYEKNNSLGKYPSDNDVNKHFISVLLLYNIIGEYALDGRNRTYFYSGLALGHATYVLSNYNIGIKFKF